jgi:hypothetical protein
VSPGVKNTKAAKLGRDREKRREMVEHEHEHEHDGTFKAGPIAT